MPVVSYALVTLSETKTYLDISSSDFDTVLENLIDGVTDFVESQIGGRRIAQESYSNEEYDIDGRFIFLKQWPVDSDSTFTVERRTGALDNPNWETKTEGKDYEPYYEEGYIDFFVPETARKLYRVSYTAGYDPIPNDLKMLAWKLIGQVFNKRTAEGLKSEDAGSWSVSFLTMTEKDPIVRQTLDAYKRWMV